MSASLLGRVLDKYRAGGFPAVAAAAAARLRYWRELNRQARPVAWSRLGALSLALARSLPPAGPPLLILGHPRSGSSWVGETLGGAANALYLHEPVSQTVLALGQREVVYPLAKPPAVERLAADKAFAGLPAFSSIVVRLPEQWGLARRRRRRLVVKEVNLLACEFYMRRYKPRIVLLIRHPAAVALSYQRLGWWGPRSTWRDHAARQAAALRYALDSLEGYRDYRVVLYEALCIDPVAQFRELFDFAGLAWEAAAEARVAEATSPANVERDVWSRRRDSRRMARSWQEQIEAAALAQVRAGFQTFGLPWYTSDQDW